jgi:prephenate dehydrogenase
MKQIVGVIGLGLIGGSIAKAYKAAGWKVLAYDSNHSITDFAILSGIVDAELSTENMKDCNVIHIAITPKAAIEYLKQNAEQMPKDSLVIDDCGTKREIARIGFELAEKHGFTFVGGHPMAGNHLSGFKNSKATMFNNASMIIVPPEFDDINLYDKIKQAIRPMGFKKVVFTTADDHDRMIAYTSQLPHVVSNAFIKSPSAQEHKGYSAGSFRDLTRVAWLNENMWTELFLENKDNLLKEINLLIDNLKEYAKALNDENNEYLCNLLRDGRIAKELSEK